MKILTNHLGYEASGPKRAVLLGIKEDKPLSFQLKRSETGEVLFEAEPISLGPVFRWRNWHFWKLDFDALAEKGDAFIECSTGAGTVRSFPFTISDNLLERNTLSDVIYYFKAQRCSGQMDLADRDLQLFGRNSLSGTYAYFREHALCKGDYKPGLTGQPDSAAVVQSVAGAIDAIGYSGIGYVTPGVRALPIAREAGQPYQPATPEKALSGEYPLSRYLYIYVNRKPGQPLPTLQREFLKLVLSRDGQEIVVKEGFIPLPAAAAARALHDAGIR